MLRRNQKSSGVFCRVCVVEYKDWVLFVYAVSHLFRLGPRNRVTLGSGQESATARGPVGAVTAAAHSYTLSCAHEHPKD